MLFIATNIFFNREKEISYFSILSDNHFGISLVKTFPGGRLEKWRDGYEVLIGIVCNCSHFSHLKWRKRRFPRRLPKRWQKCIWLRYYHVSNIMNSWIRMTEWNTSSIIMHGPKLLRIFVWLLIVPYNKVSVMNSRLCVLIFWNRRSMIWFLELMKIIMNLFLDTMTYSIVIFWEIVKANSCLLILSNDNK